MPIPYTFFNFLCHLVCTPCSPTIIANLSPAPQFASVRKTAVTIWLACKSTTLPGLLSVLKQNDHSWQWYMLMQSAYYVAVQLVYWELLQIINALYWPADRVTKVLFGSRKGCWTTKFKKSREWAVLGGSLNHPWTPKFTRGTAPKCIAARRRFGLCFDIIM